MIYYGLYALQHRGQESAGIVVGDGPDLVGHKGIGLVSEVFREDNLGKLRGSSGIGHVRYSTTGSNRLVNAQPLTILCHRGPLAMAHNGNLVNAGKLRRQLEEEGSIFQTTSDTEVLGHLVARSRQKDFLEALEESLQRVEGAYGYLLLTPRLLIGARDPQGIRPLVMGRLGEAVVLASETCALDAVEAEFVREVEPGEIIVAESEGGGFRSIRLPVSPKTARGRSTGLCIFEYIYFARPDSDLEGANVHLVRKRLGRILAAEHPVEADVVCGVPDSSLSAAAGYAEASGIPYEPALVKNRYIGRTFIQPDAVQRTLGVRLKLNANRKVVEGKRVVLLDDSIVRGTTSRRIVRLLREAGATEVHLRIASPPYTFPCFYGIDTSTSTELIAARKKVEEIREVVEADSLGYLSVPGLLKAIDRGNGHCLACFTGSYPVPVPVGAGKFALE